MTAAHFQMITLSPRLREWVPEHEPREKDPHYKLFHAAKLKMKELDLPCWRCGVRYGQLVDKGDAPVKNNPLAAYQLEAHHNEIEFSLANAVDVGKWWQESHLHGVANTSFMVQCFSQVDGWLKLHPEMKHKSHDEIFAAYVESEGNLMQLCDVCHRSKDQGIHHIPYPDWRPGPNVWRRDLPAHMQGGI